MILIAFAMATPIARYGMSRWLENFAYRIDLDWWMFAVAGLVAVVIAVVTLSFQTIRAAVANPVEGLRNQ